MSDLVNEFIEFLNESPKSSQSFLEEVAKRVNKKLGVYVDVSVYNGYMVSVYGVEQVNTFKTYVSLVTNHLDGSKIILNKPFTAKKVELVPFTSIVLILPYNGGFAIQHEEHYGDMKDIKNIVSISIPLNYSDRDISNVSNLIIGAITKFKNSISIKK